MNIKEKPHILFVGPALGSNLGFTPSPVEILAPLLEKQGFDCRITSSKIHRFTRFFDMIISIIKTRKWSNIICLQVYAYRSFVVEDLISYLAKRLHKKIVMVLHFGDFPNFIRAFPKWSKRVLTRADRIITPSNYLCNAIESYGFSAKVIPNTILIENYIFRLRDSIQPKLLWMRSFFRYYNPTLAVDTLKILCKHYPSASLTMAGRDKGLEKSTKEYSYKMGLSKSIKFPGFLSMIQKQIEFPNQDIFINTNKIDNMPISILEAAAFGLPIVSTNVGGIPYLFKDGVNALLVTPDNPIEMAKAITRLIEEPGLASHLSYEGRKLAESCSPNCVIPHWEKVFLDL